MRAGLAGRSRLAAGWSLHPGSDPVYPVPFGQGTSLTGTGLRLRYQYWAWTAGQLQGENCRGGGGVGGLNPPVILSTPPVNAP